MSDKELLVAYEDRPFESVFNVFFILLAATSFVGAFWFGGRTPSGWQWGQALTALCPASIGLFVVGALMVGGLTLATSRRPFVEEFKRRHGWKGLNDELSDARAVMEKSGAPDWMLFLSGRGLPHGSEISMSVELRGGQRPSGRLRHVSDKVVHRDSGPTLILTDVQLSGDQASQLIALLVSEQGFPLASFRPSVTDGFPFSIIALRREPFAESNAEGNLAGADATTLPLARLADAMLGAAHAANAGRTMYGACSFKGDITIGDM
jgi:hypothetical protein